MDQKKAAPKGEEEVVKTTVRLPRELWVAARKAGLDDGVDFQDLVSQGIKLYLEAAKRRLRK